MGRAASRAAAVLLVLLAGCASLGPGRLGGLPPAGPAPDRDLDDPTPPLRRLAVERSPWAALTWQEENRIQGSLGRPLPLPLEVEPESPPAAAEEWLARRSPGLARPFLDALGWKNWLKGPEVGFDGRRLRTPLERLEAWQQGWAELEDDGPPFLSLRLYPAALLRDRPAARLFFRPSRSLRVTLDQDRSSLLVRRELSSWVDAEAGCSVRFDRTGEFQAHLGATAILPAGWRIQARLGTDVHRGTLSAPSEEPGSASLGLVFTTSCSF